MRQREMEKERRRDSQDISHFGVREGVVSRPPGLDLVLPSQLSQLPPNPQVPLLSTTALIQGCLKPAVPSSCTCGRVTGVMRTQFNVSTLLLVELPHGLS